MNKNAQSGFIIPLAIVIVAALVAGGVYVAYNYGQGKTAQTEQVNNDDVNINTIAASIVPTSTLQAIINGRNARLIADMSQIRVMAELVYNANESYQTLCQSGLINIDAQANSNSSLEPIVQDMVNYQEAGVQVSITSRNLTDQSKIGLSCVSKNDKYAIGLVFATSTQGLPSSYCIDSAGHAGNNKQFAFDASSYSCIKVQATNIITSTSKPSITVLSPNGGETYNVNTDPLSVTWKGTNLPSNDGIHFSLVSGSGTIVTANAMGTGLDLKATVGSAILNPGTIQSGNYRLKITDDYGDSDMSDNYFTITN